MKKESFKRHLRILRRKKWPVALAVIVVISIIAAPIVSSLYGNYKRFAAKNPIPLSRYIIIDAEREKIHLIAHRGFSAQAPENTVPAIEKARQYGFDTVEIDVRQTQDGVWVISHDADVKSMTDKKGRIASMTYYDLVTCTVDNGAKYRDYDKLKIPTLDHMLKACLEYNIRPMIEIKDYTESGIKTLLETIDKNGFTESCSVISFDHKALELVNRQNPDIQLYVLENKLTKRELKKCLDNPGIGVSFNGHQKINDRKKIKKLLDAGIHVACWTVDDEETFKKYFEIGVTEFVTNRVFQK